MSIYAKFLQALHTAFDFHLSVGVLRVNGGLDISDISGGARQKIMETRRECSVDTSEVSLEEGSARNNSVVSCESEEKAKRKKGVAIKMK